MDGSCKIRKKSIYNQTGRNMNSASRPSRCSKRKWCMLVSFNTFFDKIFCKEKPNVENSAQIKPIISNDNSVIVAIATPATIGIKLI